MRRRSSLMSNYFDYLLLIHTVHYSLLCQTKCIHDSVSSYAINSTHEYHALTFLETGNLTPQHISHPRWFSILVVRALDSQLDGCKFDSRHRYCRVTTLGKLFTPMCLCRSHWSSGTHLTEVSEDPGSNLTAGRCLSRQPL